MMKREEIITYAGDIENYIKENIVDYFDRNNNGFMSGLQHHVRQLENRSREYHTPSFVVLVVGPVKSGKSTFVNLIAKNYVSPTHFLECTVRPSIISKKQDEAFLEVYKSCKLEDKSEQMKDILDFLNGLIEKYEIKNVEIVRHALSRENIDKYVKRNLIEVENDEILLTAIQTEGGKLLQDNVLLVDMAGFDGANANFESPAYKEIVERADLIVFVQSSNSAISKVSTDFFSLLKDRNSSVPVCLIHNVFESAYWRFDELKLGKIEEQKEYAKEVIRERHGLILDDGYAFNVNLGMVNDLRENNYKDGYKEILNKEAAEFEKAEEDIYKLFSKRERIRLRNCIERTRNKKNKLIEAIGTLQEERKELFETYQTKENVFNVCLNKIEEITFSIENPCSIEKLKQIVDDAHDYTKNSNSLQITRGVQIANMRVGAYKTKTARKIISDFLDESKKGINEYLNLKIKEIKEEASVEVMKEFLGFLTKQKEENLVYDAVLGIVAIENVVFKMEEKSITYDKISIEKIVPKLGGLNTHSVDNIHKYLMNCKNILLGSQDSIPNAKGHIENIIYPEIEAIIAKSKEDVLSSIKSSIRNKIEECKKEALEGIIPSIENFERDTEKFMRLKRNVESLTIKDLVNE